MFSIEQLGALLVYTLVERARACDGWAATTRPSETIIYPTFWSANYEFPSVDTASVKNRTRTEE